MAFLTDTFTGTDGTDLASHTADSGASWTEHASESAGAAQISNANRLFYSTVASTYYSSATPATAEYDVQSDIYVASVTGAAGPAGRVDTTTLNAYAIRYNSTAWQLFKLVSGSLTSLGTFVQTLTAGNTYTVKLEIRDATKKLFVDGVERISSTDNAVTSAGRPGTRGNIGAATETTGFHLDSLTATDAGGGSAAVQQSFALMGVGS